MLLSNQEIVDAVSADRISVLPRFDVDQLRPFGLRVHLASEVLVPRFEKVVDLRLDGAQEAVQYETFHLSQDGLRLEPKKLILGSTIESFRVSRNMVCRLDGRSTLARLGVLIHCTATVIDGNHGAARSIVLEIVNLGPSTVIIPAGYPVGMLQFETAGHDANSSSEQNQYADQNNVLGANLNFRPTPYSDDLGALSRNQ